MPPLETVPPWVPRADAFVNPAGDFIIKVELASMKRQNLDLTVDGQRVKIVGRRPDADEEALESEYLLRQISWGPFDLVVEVPPDFDLRHSASRCSSKGVLIR